MPPALFLPPHLTWLHPSPTALHSQRSPVRSTNQWPFLGSSSPASWQHLVLLTFPFWNGGGLVLSIFVPSESNIFPRTQETLRQVCKKGKLPFGDPTLWASITSVSAFSGPRSCLFSAVAWPLSRDMQQRRKDLHPLFSLLEREVDVPSTAAEPFRHHFYFAFSANISHFFNLRKICFHKSPISTESVTCLSKFSACLHFYLWSAGPPEMLARFSVCFPCVLAERLSRKLVDSKWSGNVSFVSLIYCGNSS